MIIHKLPSAQKTPKLRPKPRPKARPGYYEGYGGRLRSTRRGRAGARPLTTRGSLHLILKATQATGGWSFRLHRQSVKKLSQKFAERHGIQILNLANAGNHLHFHLRTPSRAAYKKFIRAYTSALATAVTRNSRWYCYTKKKFWDFRPFSRVVEGYAAHGRVEDYLVVNQLEMAGFARNQARFVTAFARAGKSLDYDTKVYLPR